MFCQIKIKAALNKQQQQLGNILLMHISNRDQAFILKVNAS
jgi:hypothetical protein